MIFSMEQSQSCVWINVGYGEFTSLGDALEDTAQFSKNMEIPLAELRVRVCDEIPKGVLRTCECSGRLLFTADCKTICETCQTITDIGGDK